MLSHLVFTWCCRNLLLYTLFDIKPPLKYSKYSKGFLKAVNYQKILCCLQNLKSIGQNYYLPTHIMKTEKLTDIIIDWKYTKHQISNIFWEFAAFTRELDFQGIYCTAKLYLAVHNLLPDFMLFFKFPKYQTKLLCSNSYYVNGKVDRYHNILKIGRQTTYQ